MATSAKDARKLLIIDCDAGTDDAQALMLAMSRFGAARCDLLAVTCVAGNCDLTSVCRNVLYTLDVCAGAGGRSNVPVYRGSPGFLLKARDPNFQSFHGPDGLGGVLDLPQLDEGRLQSEHAANALVRLTREHPGQITLIMVGPLTNGALAQKLDPEFGSRLAELYIMGGNTQGKGNSPVNSEFNVYCDPEAAYIVFNEFTCPKYVVSWETCLDNYLSWEWCEHWVAGQTTDKAKFNAAILKTTNHKRRYLSKAPGYYCCDGYTVIAALEPQVVTDMVSHNVSVELGGTYSRAQMVVDWRNYMEDQGKEIKTNVVLKLDTNKLKVWMEQMTQQ